jgi:TolB-like protein/Flp pilus assembly protein TadD
MIGEIVSHYRILGRLGKGGMGVVYKAEDVRLGRTVALKFLPEELVESRIARERFLREARAASGLDHPNICTIFEVDEFEKRPFIAMAFYEGETLERRIDRGPLPVAEAVEVTIQIAEGLGKAHEQGIVHRDVKPANIMITPEGAIKILDFGVARAIGSSRLTSAGTAIGTVAYMSPEQARSTEVDHRSDIWALGVLLYQMVTGEVPFTGERDIAVIQSILTAEVPPIATDGGGEVTELNRVLQRALHKEPSGRYSSVQEFIGSLGPLVGDPTSSTRPLYPVRAQSQVSVAVLPFQDLSPEQDQEYFCFGMAEELTNLLARVRGLRVASRTSAFQFAGKAEDARKIGEQLGVEHILEGSVRKAGERVRVSVQLVQTSDGYQVWSDRYDRELQDLFALQDEIAHRIAEALEITLMGHTSGGALTEERNPLFLSRAMGNLEAYNLYLKGRYYWNKRTPEGLQRGAEYFQQVIEKEPGYARAYAGLADSYALLGIYGIEAPREVMPKAEAAAAKALSLDPNLAAVYTSRGCVRAAYGWDFHGAAADFQNAIQLDPLYATTYHWYAMYTLIPWGRFEDAAVQLHRALELDPLSLAINASIGLHRFFARRYPDAVEEYRKALEIDPGFAMAHFFLGQVYIEMGRATEAIRELEQAIELAGGSPEMIATLACAHARGGNGEEARKVLEGLQIQGRQRYVSPVVEAQVHVALGNSDAALARLEDAYEARAADLLWIGVRPLFDPLRTQPRFRRLLELTGLDASDPLQETTEVG